MNKTKQASTSAPNVKSRAAKRTHPWRVTSLGKLPVRQRSWLDVIR